MNRQIVQVFGLVIVLFGVLVGYTTYWTVVNADELEDETANRRPLIEEIKEPRGLILARDGTTVLARSVPRGRGENRIFTRTYPNGPLFGHVVGFADVRQGKDGLEASRNDELTGKENEFQSIISELQSEKEEGADVVTTLDPEAQALGHGAAGRSEGVGRCPRAGYRPSSGHGQRAAVRPERGGRLSEQAEHLQSAPRNRATRRDRRSRS